MFTLAAPPAAQPVTGTQKAAGFGRVIAFIAGNADDPRDVRVVASVLLAMDEAPLAVPLIIPARGLDGAHYVGVSIGAPGFRGAAFRLTPDEARLVSDALWADPVGPGFADVAQRLRDAARLADRAFLRSGL